MDKINRPVSVNHKGAIYYIDDADGFPVASTVVERVANEIADALNATGEGSWTWAQAWAIANPHIAIESKRNSCKIMFDNCTGVFLKQGTLTGWEEWEPLILDNTYTTATDWRRA